MILISIQPFVARKILSLLVSLFCFANASAFAGALLLPVESTPYDRQMSRIRPVLAARAATHRSEISMAVVNQWMGSLREIPYGYHMEWRTPAEVESGQPADCKGKAVALYRRMLEQGATNVRLVIGKRASNSRSTHAWLQWETSAGRYVLDPTFHWMATRSESLGDRSYVPLYAYSGTRKFRAASAPLFANN